MSVEESGCLAWHGFRTGLWQKEINVRDFIQQNYEPYDGDDSFLAPATDADEAHLGHAERAVRRGAQERACSTSRRSPARSPRTRPATSTATTKSSSVCRPTRRSSARSCRMAASGWSSTRSRPTATSPIPHVVEAFTKYRKTHNEARLRCLHGRRAALPQLAYADRTARCVRPRPHHRRLPARRALRRHAADRAQAGGEERPRLGCMSTDEIIRDREELSEQIRALKELQQMAASYGFDISVPARNAQEAVQWLYLRLPRRRERTERRGDVARAHLDVPRHLLRARPGGRRADRGAGAGDHRRLRHQAAHRSVSAHAGIRRAVRRRSDLGHRIDRRHGGRRPVAGDENELPVSADALQPRPGAGAESDDLVFAAAAGRLPPLRGARWRSTPARFNSRATRSCAARGATTARSPAASRRC